MAGKSRMPSRIAFDYEAPVFGFGAGIEEAEAAELISRTRQRRGIAQASTRHWVRNQFLAAAVARLWVAQALQRPSGTRILRDKIKVP